MDQTKGSKSEGPVTVNKANQYRFKACMNNKTNRTVYLCLMYFKSPLLEVPLNSWWIDIGAPTCDEFFTGFRKEAEARTI